MIDSVAQSYNTFPYESLAVKQTHPLHLYRIASLYGLQAKPVNEAKVLELGCASGGNLIPMAYYLPATTFVGIDLAKQQIQEGLQQMRDLALQNIELHCQSLSDFQAAHRFDYIICHGLYSWVQPEIRQQVLTICRQYLSEQGIAYISYNTSPGWNTGNAIRELLQWQTKKITSVIEKIAKARLVLAELATGLVSADSPFAHLLRDELALISEHSDHQLLHEHLSPSNDALLFLQFVEQASRYQLAYLGDAFLSNDSAHELSVIQSRDFLQNRRLRCSLLCHEKMTRYQRSADLFAKLNTTPNYQDLVEYYQAGVIPAKPQVFPLIQYQALRQDYVNSPLHENIRLTPFAECLLPYLDGKHDFQTLVQWVIWEIREGNLLRLDAQGKQTQNEELKVDEIVNLCQETLHLMAQKALFVSES